MVKVRVNRWVLTVLTALISLFSYSLWANTLEGVRVWPSPDETRVVIDLQSEADFSYFTLSSPNRLVVDLNNTSLNTKLPLSVSDSPVLSQVRKSTPPKKSTYRLVFELKRKVQANIFKLAPVSGGQYGHRLVIDLPHGLTTKSVSTVKAPEVSKDVSQIKRQEEILIVIDPGHGGEDPGSIGPSRKYEKNATLSISKKLAAQLNAIPGIKARLTRSGDYYVNLNRRVAIASENNAHLLISIHADAFTTPQPKGGSVFVLNTRRANTEISRWIEDKEKQSELLGGGGAAFPSSINDRNVNQTLLDLQFSHSQKEGYKLATEILSEMGKVTKLHNSKPINTSLAVLRSPQIPSVLVETGFISNPTEEKLLFQRAHQDKLSRSITKAVVKYLKANPPEGTYFKAQTTPKTYKVKRGDSLSAIAKKYSTSTSTLMKANKLKSSSLAIGQVLTIPAAGSVSTAADTVETKVVTHTVRSGDYLGKIASRYKVTIVAIKRENNLKSDTLKLGQKLKITVSLKDVPIRKHTVKRGDYLGKIASQYGVPINSIRQANKLRSDELAIGQILIIPNK
ncbi:LysM peptidoglycan-binding domain-containing protein [Vibrio genomosp. F10]|uniref:LysM peptidoglycan-binding domain-containing protein n=1 Tax=Vibrio genomosp. F10 TaxID=723171 RepID=UPI003D68A8F8